MGRLSLGPAGTRSHQLGTSGRLKNTRQSCLTLGAGRWGHLSTNSRPWLAGRCSPSINLLHSCPALHTSPAWGPVFQYPLNKIQTPRHGPLYLHDLAPAFLSLSFILLQAYLASLGSSKSGRSFQPQDLCTCRSHCMECSFPISFPGSCHLPFHASHLKWPLIRGPLWPPPQLLFIFHRIKLCDCIFDCHLSFPLEWVCMDRTQVCLAHVYVPGTSTCPLVMPVK